MDDLINLKVLISMLKESFESNLMLSGNTLYYLVFVIILFKIDII